MALVAGVSLRMPYYPHWSLTVVAIDAFAIRAVAEHGRDITR